MIIYWKENFISGSSTDFENPGVLNGSPLLTPLCWLHQGTTFNF